MKRRWNEVESRKRSAIECGVHYEESKRFCKFTEVEELKREINLIKFEIEKYRFENETLRIALKNSIKFNMDSVRNTCGSSVKITPRCLTKSFNYDIENY